MLRIGETTWIKPDYIVHILIGNGKLSLIDTLHVTHYVEVEDEWLESVCSVFSLNLGKTIIAIKKSREG